ncbi:MAG: GyrI-like domain-containing protein [Bacteroidota bacterium]|nr:GyrI-like domain-containing protein [Bacteroidota bacterium]
MKILRKIIIWVIAILAILVIVAYLLPGNYQVERSITINADKEIIYDYLCDFNKWEEWTPWSEEMDSTVTMEIVGSCEVGSMQKWEDKTGNGQLIITKMLPYQLIQYDLSFYDGKYTSVGKMIIEPQGEEGFLITWSDEGELGYNPIHRYMGLMMDSQIGPEFLIGLENLKKLAEAQPDYPDIEVTEIQVQPALSIKGSCNTTEIGDKLGEFYGKLMVYLQRKRIEQAGPPYAVYYEWNEDGTTSFEAGIPVSKEVKGKDEILAGNTPGGKVVKVLHQGPYDDNFISHEAIQQYIKVNQLEMAGVPWEVYITDRAVEPDESKLETLVLYPIK